MKFLNTAQVIFCKQWTQEKFPREFFFSISRRRSGQRTTHLTIGTRSHPIFSWASWYSTLLVFRRHPKKNHKKKKPIFPLVGRNVDKPPPPSSHKRWPTVSCVRARYRVVHQSSRCQKRSIASHALLLFHFFGSILPPNIRLCMCTNE